MNNYNTPILFIIFNRPELTAKAFEQIRNIKPSRLYIASDGPRFDTEVELNLVKSTREIVSVVDWESDVKRKYNNHNLGCGKNVSTAINWLFENEEMGIILEDDCVASPAFFPYAGAMLEYYKNDSRIMHISGSRYNTERKRNEASYFFSKYGHIWGWATWRRAWQKFDLEMSKWPECYNDGILKDRMSSEKEYNYWSYKFNRIFNSEIMHSWGFQWQFCLFINNGLCITPRENLISNVGSSGVHTKKANKFLFRTTIDSYKILDHPNFILQNSWFDNFHFLKHFYKKRNFIVRVLRKVRRSIKKL